MELPFKISALVFVRNRNGEHLMIERRRQPNRGLWSPIGGKLEMSRGESPFECAIRETREEIGLEIGEKDLHLFSMITERAYEGGAHWLMFLFDCKKRADELPQSISEGGFAFFPLEKILSDELPIPETDRTLLWDIWQKHHDCGQVVLRANCEHGVKSTVEETII